MSVYEIVVIIFTVIGLLGTLTGFIIRVSVKNGKLEQKFDDLKTDVESYHVQDRKDIAELFESRKENEKEIVRINAKLDGIRDDVIEIKELLRGGCRNGN